MKKILLAAIALVFFATAAKAETWDIDPAHSAAHFAIQHMMIAKVRGSFPDIKGMVSFKDGMPTKFDVTIAVDSINTGVTKRDAHLKSSDFLEVDTYPTMKFVSSGITKTADGFDTTGKLTIKNVTRDVTFAITGLNDRREDPWGFHRLGGKAELTIDRREFAVEWNQNIQGGGFLIGNEVDIIVDFELLPAS